MVDIIYVSKQGLELLNKRLKKANDDLSKIRAEKNLAYTATGDTWHDNPYFNKLEQDEKRKTEDIAETTALLACAQIFSFDKRNTAQVQLGSIVHLSCYYVTGKKQEEFVWEVVGYGEINVAKKQVAYNSPLIQSVIGLSVGDCAQAMSPKGPVEYEIIGLYPDWDSVPDNLRI